ncbi:contractile injection system tape measure protein [Pontibacter russatus]|uniref:contractile injection system tape measure protein n=1 Tax=Pontibacter russatus TaxID=2694929 RepID=UPI00137B3677|nr:contractile injection system tape measure protein [Pontibacter russatus]
MRARQHIIRKQTIALQLSKKADAFEMQQLMHSHYWRSIVPTLERLFDEVCPEGETLCIDSLEINLGNLPAKEMHSQQWGEALLSGIAAQVYKKLSAGAAGPKATVRLQTNAASAVQQWLSYMRNGYLPWNALYINDASKQQVLQALEKDAAGVSQLRTMLLKNDRAADRVAAQHGEGFLQHLVETLTSARHPRLGSLLYELELIWKQLRKSHDRKFLINPGSGTSLWKQTLQAAAALPNADTNVLSQHVLDRCTTLSSLKTVLPSLEGLLPHLSPLLEKWAAANTSFKDDITRPIQFKPKPADFPANLREVPDEVLADEAADSERKLLKEEGIFVQHAGLVLLHPFLSTFFNRLQLTHQGSFTDSKTQQKALYLLHYLATGEKTAEEYELVVPKVLCAYQLQQPVSKKISLLEHETEEADQLLQEAIRQWQVLKNTSPAGLQETFLQRRGKLLSKNETLCLQLEAGAMDVLLDYLPWNLSILKLPWMKSLLHVEWR